LGQTLQRPLPEPVAIAAFDDGYLIPREFRFAGETFPDHKHASVFASRSGKLPFEPVGPAMTVT
jgi:hypothetical protein